MSAADVEFIHKMLDTFNRGGRQRSLDYLHDDVQLLREARQAAGFPA